MQARLLILLGTFVLTGCNLFAKTTGTHDWDSGTDGGPADVSDSGRKDSDTIDASVRTDVSEPSDMRPPGDGCIAPSDAELCATYGIECGELLVRAPGGLVERHKALDVATTNGCGTNGEYLNGCNSGTGPTVDFDAATDGDYVVRVHLWASQASSGTILARVRITQDGNTIREIPVTGTEEALGTYEVLVPLTSGTHQFTWRLANDYYDPSIPEDRNLYFDWVEIEGPMVAPADTCGTARTVQCGGCSGSDACGFERVGHCGCACTNADGTCAPEGAQAGNACAVCVIGEGWAVAEGDLCDDGDPCTNDSCDARRAVCVNSGISCPGDACEGGMCVNGSCEYTAMPDDSACGAGGVCMAGECACPDGTDIERQCADQDDGDCDGLTDCDDPDCEGRNCGPGGVTCSMGDCE